VGAHSLGGKPLVDDGGGRFHETGEALGPMIESRLGVGAAFLEDTEKVNHKMAHGCTGRDAYAYTREAGESIDSEA
jgi:hypothetical protein